MEKKTKRKLNLNDYKGAWAIHYKNKEEFETVCKFMHNAGKTWGNGKSFLDSTTYDEGFSVIAIDLCYRMEYGSARIAGYRILNFDDFKWD